MSKTISEKIYDLRKAKGLSQERLGELLGVSGQAVSKWEKADSLPDISVIPSLCEALNVTADELLGVSSSVKTDNCMNALWAYSKEVGKFQAGIEAAKACCYSPDKVIESGVSHISGKGVFVFSPDGFSIVINGEELLKNILNVDTEYSDKIISLLTDKKIIAVIKHLSMEPISEEELIERTGLNQQEVEATLFKLMKYHFVQCSIDEDKYLLGEMSYVLISFLTAMYISSPRSKLGNISMSYTD